jgi:hypothetical protein
MMIVRPDTDLCYGSARRAVKGLTANDCFRLVSGAVPLSLDDLARQEDVLQVEDSEAVVFEFLGCVDRDEVLARSNEASQ